MFGPQFQTLKMRKIDCLVFSGVLKRQCCHPGWNDLFVTCPNKPNNQTLSDLLWTMWCQLTLRLEHLDSNPAIFKTNCLLKVSVPLWRRQSCRTSAPPRPSCWTHAQETRTAPARSATRTFWSSPATARSSTPWWASSTSLETWTLPRGGSMPSCRLLYVG